MLTKISDVIIHFGIYALWSFLLFLGFYRKNRFGLLLLLVGIPLIFGITIEWIQGSFIPGRTASLSDAFSNAIGVLIGSLIGRKLKN